MASESSSSQGARNSSSERGKWGNTTPPASRCKTVQNADECHSCARQSSLSPAQVDSGVRCVYAVTPNIGWERDTHLEPCKSQFDRWLCEKLRNSLTQFSSALSNYIDFRDHLAHQKPCRRGVMIDSLALHEQLKSAMGHRCLRRMNPL